MQPFPHLYRVTATGAAAGRVRLEHDGADPIESSPPVEFGGPGDAWSPEGLLLAAVADCFILTFRAVARAAHLDWSGLDVEVRGTLERVDGVTSFTSFALHAALGVGVDTDPSQAEAALQRAEHGCLVSNSLKARVHLTTTLLQPA